MFEVHITSFQMLRHNLHQCRVDPVMSGGFFFFFLCLTHTLALCVCMCVLIGEWSGGKEGWYEERERDAEEREIKRKVRRKGKGNHWDQLQTCSYRPKNPLWMRNHVGKERRGRGKSGAMDHRGIVRTFSSQNQTDTGSLPGFICHPI